MRIIFRSFCRKNLLIGEISIYTCNQIIILKGDTAKVTSHAAVDKVTGQKRAYALDALRGLAILMMVLSGMEPSHLPSFMYHGQVPPPDFKFIPIPGVTWVDMVLPFFLFSMGAAIPFAIGRRIEKGKARYQLVGSTLLRGLILGLFALYVEHIRTGGMSGSPFQIFFWAVIGFLILFPALGRLPSNWSKTTRTLVKIAGWIAAIILMISTRYNDPNGARFSLSRVDIIIVILANVAVYTTLVYLLTRKNIPFRLGFLGFLIAMRLSTSVPGWIQSLYANFPIPYLGNLKFLGPTAISILGTVNSFFNLGITHYLFIAIPGTIIGDMILNWMNEPESKLPEKRTWSGARCNGLAFFLFGVAVLTLILLKGRHIWQLVLCLIPLLVFGNWLVRKPAISIEYLIHKMYKWGMYLLAVGIFFEPYEGGIKKDGATMSYFLVSGGLAIFMLIVFTVIVDIFKKKKAVQLLIDNGQNPMVAYTAGGNFILPILTITGIGAFLEKHIPAGWPGFFYAVVVTLVVALVTRFCTRKKLFWRT